MSDIEDLESSLGDEHGLAVISTTQADGRVLSSVANCGIIEHPISGASSVAMVSAGGAARLTHIRRGSQVTVTVRRGWQWVSVTGRAEIIGPREMPAGVDAEALRLLLRQIFQAAGGTHDNYDEFDTVMASEERAAVLIAPDRILGNS